MWTLYHCRAECEMSLVLTARSSLLRSLTLPLCALVSRNGGVGAGELAAPGICDVVRSAEPLAHSMAGSVVGCECCHTPISLKKPCPTLVCDVLCLESLATCLASSVLCGRGGAVDERAAAPAIKE